MEKHEYIEFNPSQLPKLQSLNVVGPVQMLNLLKFKKRVLPEGISGLEQYKLYMKAAMPFIKEANANVVLSGKSELSIIGPEQEWDYIVIVEYASLEVFLKMASNKAFPTNLRNKALEDSRLIILNQKDK